MEKIKIEIWSDVVCPFCYIGKRRLEFALDKMNLGERVEITWKSFQLDPDAVSVPDKTPFEYLAERYGRDLAWSKAAHDNVTKMASEVGLTYRFDIAKISNSFDAHRLAHFAKSEGKGNEFEELLFKAYFCEGKNISDKDTLVDLASAAGLNRDASQKLLEGTLFGNAVRQDIIEAQQLGITGVPFFVFNRKLGISGAQPEEVFMNTLQEILSDLN